MRILAKSAPEQDIYDHLSDVKNNILALLTPARLAAFTRLGIGASQATDLVVSAAWLHDWGKATNQWQAGLRSGGRMPQHSLTGFFASLWAFNSKVHIMPGEQLAVSLAVLGHHGQLSKGSFQDSNFSNEIITPCWDEWRSLLDELPIRNTTASTQSTLQANMVCAAVQQAKIRVPSFPRSFHGLYCLLISLLIEADHQASAGTKPNPTSVGLPNMPYEINAFQHDVRESVADLLCVVAGCGSGKTAAALLRAADLAAQSKIDRVVICLPTRFTSNALWRDMWNPEAYGYSVDQVGLVHSEALYVLSRSAFDGGDELDFPMTQGTPEEHAGRGVRYEHPVTISTVDHLLMSLYHGYKFSDRAFGNLLSSLVVFDEVHAYDNCTLNAIRDGIDVLSSYGIPTLFMSATLPQSRRAFLLTKAQVIEKDNPFVPFVIRKLSSPLTSGRGVNLEATPSAQKLIRESIDLKLAVYANQVERAKALVRAAIDIGRDTPIYCYHSELSARDRANLETKIVGAFRTDKPVIAVMTQAAELSLNISAERMIAELAVADDLIQRGGRLNRRGYSSSLAKKTDRLPQGFIFELLIAPLSEEELRDQDPLALPYTDTDQLRTTWDKMPTSNPFTFNDGLEWCETVLSTPPSESPSGLIQAVKDDSVFGNKPQDNFGNEGDPGKVIIRIIEPSVMVLPEAYLSELEVDCDPVSLSQFLVPIRRNKFWSIDEGLGELRFIPITIGRGSRKQAIVSYPVKVIKNNIPYDPLRGGFDFRSHTVTQGGSCEGQFH